MGLLTFIGKSGHDITANGGIRPTGMDLGDDVGKARMWWRNRLLKVFLCFILPGFGSFIGTWVGGFEIIIDAMRFCAACFSGSR